MQVDIIELSCIWKGWSWKHNLVFQMMLPPMIALFCYFSYVGSKLLWHLRRANDGRRQSLLQRNVQWLLQGIFTEPNSDESLQEIGLEKISTVIAFTNIIYLTLCKYSLAPFLCEALPYVEHDPFTGRAPNHPKLVLKAYPELECWAGWHWVYIGVGAVGLVVYLLGLPCGIALVLHKIRTKKLHTDHHTLLAFGALYTKYEARAWWYEIIQVSKRTIFAFLAVFDDNAELQCLGAQLAVVGLTVVHFVHLPYIYGGLDKLDCYYLISLMIFSLFGLMFSLLPHECDAGPTPGSCPKSVIPRTYFWLRAPLEDAMLCFLGLSVPSRLLEMLKETAMAIIVLDLTSLLYNVTIIIIIFYIIIKLL